MVRNWRAGVVVLASVSLLILVSGARTAAEQGPESREPVSVPSSQLSVPDSFWSSLGLESSNAANGPCGPGPASIVPSGGDGQGSVSIPTSPSGLQATFHLCGQSDPQTQRSIEQFVAGRAFSSRLVSRPDGCADLTIIVSLASSSVVTGSQSTNLSISTGSGRQIAVHIISENGATHVAIGPNS